MAETWYAVEGYRHKIKPYQVHKFTDKSVWVFPEWSHKLERQLRSTGYSRFFPNAEEAIAFVEDSLRRSVESYRDNLDAAEEELTEFLKRKVSGSLIETKPVKGK